MKDFIPYITQAVSQNASDLFFIAGLPPSYKCNGTLSQHGDERLTPSDTEEIISQIYALSQKQTNDVLEKTGADDFSFSIAGLSRFRVNIYRQRNSVAAVIRVIRFELPSPESLSIPQNVMDMAGFQRGMVLVTGPAGSGKSSTQATLIDLINRTRGGHIVTLEDPIEFLHSHKKSIVSQREVGVDTESFVSGLRDALRQAPDVILLGEMRDHETISTAITAAETGHFVISTLHTTGAANTIDRIVDSFPAGQQNQVRIQLSMVLKGIISQQLIPATGGGVTAAFECLRVTPAIANLIRESKVSQIDGAIATGGKDGMQAMDADILRLFQAGRISKEDALRFSLNHIQMARRLGE